jgi:DNA polymerase III gamma/tau subunit
MILNSDSLNEQIKNEFHKTISGGRRPHAVLIDGGTENEREDIAYLLAKVYVCSDESSNEPCNACSSCRKTDERIHPDIIRVTKPDDKKYFKKDDLKKVVEDAYQTPNEAKVRVFILSEMQLMKVESQNVLLKILEEPPVYTVFILTSENANSVIGTVLSRVSRFRIGEKNSDTDFDEKAIEIVKSTAEAIASNYEFDVISATSALEGNKQLTANVLKLLALFFRDAVALKNGGNPLIAELSDEARKIAFSFSTEKLLSLYESMNELIRLTEGYPNYTLLVAQLCAKLKT